jgi:predicted NBD/HSP70 family sugar kinase
LITSQAGQQPADFTDVRATNLAVVLRFVRAEAPCSRADIAASTGLNKATVSSLVAELIERRLVREIGLTEHRIGRPATMIVLDGAAYAAVGIEVNTDHLTAVAIDLAGVRLLSWRRAFAGRRTPAARAVATVAALARKAVAKVVSEDREVLGLTVGVAGLVDDSGVVRLAPNLDWRDLALREALIRAMDRPSFPVAVENDANLAARAEHRYGAYAGTPNLVYLNGHAGVGSGIIADGRLLRGGLGYSGELGHVQIDPDGPRCGCGRRGCLETVASVSALIRRVGDSAERSEARADNAERSEAQPDSDVVDLDPEVEDVIRRAKAEDPVVIAALRDLGRHLGYGVSILSNVVNPEVVILGGYFVPLAQWIMPAAEAEMRDKTAAPNAGGCRLAPSTLGQGAAATGGAASILDTVDSGRLPAPRSREGAGLAT